MADMTPAKAGEKIPIRARRAWAARTREFDRAMREGLNATQAMERALAVTPTHIAPKSNGTRGAWFCMHCGTVHRNQMEAHTHAEKHPKHAWLSLESDQLEEP